MTTWQSYIPSVNKPIISYETASILKKMYLILEIQNSSDKSPKSPEYLEKSQKGLKIHKKSNESQKSEKI